MYEIIYLINDDEEYIKKIDEDELRDALEEVLFVHFKCDENRHPYEIKAREIIAFMLEDIWCEDVADTLFKRFYNLLRDYFWFKTKESWR